MKVTEAAEIIQTCDMLGCSKIEEKLVRYMSTKSTREPWNLFRLASQRKDVTMGKWALKAMGTEPSRHLDLRVITEENLTDVSNSFLAELLRVHLKRHKDDDGESYRCIDWKTVSERFDPFK